MKKHLEVTKHDAVRVPPAFRKNESHAMQRSSFLHDGEPVLGLPLIITAQTLASKFSGKTSNKFIHDGLLTNGSVM